MYGQRSGIRSERRGPSGGLGPGGGRRVASGSGRRVGCRAADPVSVARSASESEPLCSAQRITGLRCTNLRFCEQISGKRPPPRLLPKRCAEKQPFVQVDTRRQIHGAEKRFHSSGSFPARASNLGGWPPSEGRFPAKPRPGTRFTGGAGLGSALEARFRRGLRLRPLPQPVFRPSPDRSRTVPPGRLMHAFVKHFAPFQAVLLDKSVH